MESFHTSVIPLTAIVLSSIYTFQFPVHMARGLELFREDSRLHEAGAAERRPAETE